MPPKEIKSFGQPEEYTITFTGTPEMSIWKNAWGDEFTEVSGSIGVDCEINQPAEFVTESEDSMNTLEKVREHFQSMLDRGMSVDEVEALGWSIEKAKRRESMIKSVLEVCEMVEEREEKISLLEDEIEKMDEAMKEDTKKRYEAIRQRDKMQERINTLIDSLGVTK